MKRVDLIRRITSYAVLFISVLVCGNVGSHGQDTNKSNPPQAPQQPASQPSISPLPVQLDGNAVLHHLNQVISWYRHMTTSVRDVGLPSDAIYQDNAKALGAKAVQLAFQSAKSQSALIAGQQGEAPNQGAGNTQQQRIEQLRAKITAQVDQLQKQIDELSTRIPKTAASRRTGLMSQRDVLKAQLDLQKSRLDVMQKMSSFIESSGETARGLEGDINRLAQSVPEVLGPNSGKGETQDKIAAAKSPSKPGLANSGGLIGDAMTLYDYTTVLRQISSVIKETNYTHDVTEEVRKPLRDALRAALQQSQQSDTQSAASDPQQLQEQRQQLQEINERFKQLSNALLPLSQELIVLNNARTNLDQWRDSIVRESTYVLRSVLLRVLMILIALAAVLVFSEVWRRVTFRYVTDARRRRQFLVLRRVVIGFLVVVVLTFGFVSQFSSLATFAGFITAGIAVGLQAVLLSIAAYFFIIGRYGIRVGDRISVAGITGDVVDIGLVRMYVLELAGTGLDFYPTGRIVAFSNSVLFQTGTPLFRQIPGTEYTWHEVVVRLVPDANHKAAEEKLMAVVEDVYSKYRGEIERQHAAIERRVDIQVDMPRPEARLQFADTGLELLVRYPVEIRQAPNTDEEMTRRVLELIAKDDAVKATVSGTPKIRSAIKG